MSDQPIVRTARVSDVDAVFDLVSRGGSGLTNLPADRPALTAKLEASERALNGAEAREAGAAIFLVVTLGSQVVGTSAVWPRVGAEWPFYSYRLTRQAHRSTAIGKLQAQTLLNIVNDFDGEAEVGGLFIDPLRRGLALGALAARARYLFIAEHREWFRRRVMAELRGWQDAAGRSPVWEAIGRHFYAMDFHEADRVNAIGGNQFIADLGPRYPLYCAMLPEDARAALGRPHDDGRPAYDMLIAEGFASGDYVDIFDGGPTVFADIDDVLTVRTAREVAIERVGTATRRCLVSAGRADGFRVARGALDADGAIDADLARDLRVETGTTVRAVALD